MGGPNSGRRSIKLRCIEGFLDIQAVLYPIVFGDQSVMTKEEILEEVKTAYKKTKVVQEEIEEIRVQ